MNKKPARSRVACLSRIRDIRRVLDNLENTTRAIRPSDVSLCTDLFSALDEVHAELVSWVSMNSEGI